MHPLKILAFVIIGFPVSAFLLTLFLTDGAPLKPLTPGEESGPVAATRALPQAEPERPLQERQGSVVAAGLSQAAPARMINHGRDAQLFIKLFGTPHPN